MRRLLKTTLLSCVMCFAMAAAVVAETITVANVAAMATARPGDGDVIVTLGKTAAGDGGTRTYRYDADSAATADGFNVVDGPGSVGRYVALDQEMVGIQVVNAAKFGATGDGSTDDQVALQAWLDAYDDGARYFVLEPNKTYIVGSFLLVDQMTDFVIDLNGSTIKCASTATIDANGQALRLARSDRFEVRNGVFDGNRASRDTPDQVPAHNVAIYGCDDFTFYRIVSKEAVVDGFYMDEYTPGTASTSNYRGSFINCIADSNTRQGMSIISGHDIQIRGGAFKNSSGLAPQAGIDLEADGSSSDPAITGVVIDGVTFEGNWGASLQLSQTSGARDTVVRNCIITGTPTEATVTYTNATDVVNAVGHPFQDGMNVVLRTTGTVPTGLSRSVVYTVMNATSDAFQLGTGEPAVVTTFSSDGTGTNTVGMSNNYILAWHSCVLDGNTIRGINQVAGAVHIGASTEGRCRVVNNRFKDCCTSYAFAVCVYVHGSSEGRTIIANNFAEDCNGFCDINGGYVTVSGNVIDSPTKTYANLAAVGANARAAKLVNNTVVGGYLNLVFSDCDAEDIDLSIIGNSFINPTGVGDNPAYGAIKVADNNALIADNIITLDSSVSAIAIDVTGNNCLIDGNKIVGYTFAGPINVAAGSASRITSTNLPMNMITATSLDATPSVRGSEYLTTANGGATTITAFDDGVAGQSLLVKIGDANTTIDFSGTTLKGNAGVDWTPASGDSMRGTFDGTNWYFTTVDATP